MAKNRRMQKPEIERRLLRGVPITVDKIRGIWDFPKIDGMEVTTETFRLLVHYGLIEMKSEEPTDNGVLRRTFLITRKGVSELRKRHPA